MSESLSQPVPVAISLAAMLARTLAVHTAIAAYNAPEMWLKQLLHSSVVLSMRAGLVRVV